MTLESIGPEEFPSLLMGSLSDGRRVLHNERATIAASKRDELRQKFESLLVVARICRDAVLQKLPVVASVYVQDAREIIIERRSDGEVDFAVVNIRIPGAAWIAARVVINETLPAATITTNFDGQFRVGRPEWRGPEIGLFYSFTDPYVADCFEVALAVARETYEAGVRLAEKLKDIPF